MHHIPQFVVVGAQQPAGLVNGQHFEQLKCKGLKHEREAA